MLAPLILKILVLIEFLAAKSFWATAVSERIGTGVGSLTLGRQSSSQLTSQPHLLLPPKPILCSSSNALLASPNPLTYFHASKHVLRLFPLLRMSFPCILFSLPYHILFLVSKWHLPCNCPSKHWCRMDGLHFGGFHGNLLKLFYTALKLVIYLSDCSLNCWLCKDRNCIGGVLVNWFSKKKKILICSICLSPWYKYSHHGQLRAPSVKSLNTELGRGTHPAFVSWCKPAQ